jgi:DNA-binding NtrC family response regulator
MNTKKQILVIDDDTQIQELLQMFLENNGCDVATASTGEKGLAKARKSNFDLVLLDIILPDSDGISVLKNLKKILPNASVLMITGGNDTIIAENCLRDGAVDYITKPFDFEYLRTTVLANLLGAS